MGTRWRFPLRERRDAVRIISRKALKDHWTEHPDAEASLKAWYAEVKKAAWDGPAEVKAKYGSASILKEGRVVFNVCGNKYRLIAKVNYAASIVFIRFVGTHREYDAVDAQTI